MRYEKSKLIVRGSRIVYGSISTSRGIVSRYGLSPYEFADMIDAQLGLCPVCRAPLSGRVAVDHCHDDSRRVRGILHTRCNVAIGLLDDDPDTLDRAAIYLRTVPA